MAFATIIRGERAPRAHDGPDQLLTASTTCRFAVMRIMPDYMVIRKPYRYYDTTWYSVFVVLVRAAAAIVLLLSFCCRAEGGTRRACQIPVAGGSIFRSIVFD